MKKPQVWFRLCVDVDHNGNTRGGSYEVHEDDQTVSVFTYTPGPFDGSDEVLEHLRALLIERYGVQLSML